MSNREEAKQIIDKLPEYKIEKILLFLKGIEFDDEMEDDIFCENIANYAQTECQFRYCGTAIPFLTVRSTAR